MDELNFMDYYNIPRVCKKCGGVMIYKGVGEYHCEECDAVDFDDYGKVRRYIEEHHGATAAAIENAIGVPQRTIRRLLKEGRLEVAEGSKAFLHCEMCGKAIRSGQYCSECEMNVHRGLEAKQREMLQKGKNAQGYGKGQQGESGQRRFVRES